MFARPKGEQTPSNSSQTSCPLQTLVSPTSDAVQIRITAGLLFSVHWDDGLYQTSPRMKRRGDPMMHPVLVNVGGLHPLEFAKYHFYATRKGWRTVLIRLDMRCRGVIKSFELQRWGGVVIPLVIERTTKGTLRPYAAFVWLVLKLRTRDATASLENRPEAGRKTENLRKEVRFCAGGDRALEPCKSL